MNGHRIKFPRIIETSVQQTSATLIKSNSYDGFNWLTGTNSSTSADTQAFSLDAFGNMASVTTNGTTENRTTNSQNQLTVIGASTLTYDDNGNMTTDDQGHTLVYDAWNRLVGVYDGSTFIVGFTYDGMGRRTQEITLDVYGNPVTRDLYYSTSWQILDETVTTTGTTLKDVRNVWSPAYVNALLLRDKTLQ